VYKIYTVIELWSSRGIPYSSSYLKIYYFIFSSHLEGEKTMDKLQFSIVIDAPKEKVWNTMLNEDTYKVWTEPFAPGSHYKGDWKQGSKILFLAPDSNGQMGGMVSRIKDNKPYEFISIEHLGYVQDGKEDTESEEVKKWAGAHENYTFKEKDGRTELTVDMDTSEEFTQMFEGLWPKALQKLKETAEK
jgi:ligand-binding SRPBCC domain-containing protein